MKRLLIDGNTSIPVLWVAGSLVFIVTTVITLTISYATLRSDVAQAKVDIIDTKELFSSEQKEQNDILRRLDRGLLKIQLKLEIDPDKDIDR